MRSQAELELMTNTASAYVTRARKKKAAGPLPKPRLGQAESNHDFMMGVMCTLNWMAGQQEFIWYPDQATIDADYDEDDL
jgi:hypothetical protein